MRCGLSSVLYRLAGENIRLVTRRRIRCPERNKPLSGNQSCVLTGCREGNKPELGWTSK